MKFFRIFCILCLLVLLFMYNGINTIFFTRPPLKYVQLDPVDLFITSAYYYPKSESMGENAVAIVFTGDFTIFQRIKVVQLLGANSSKVIIANATLEKVALQEECQWIPIFATAQLVPNMENLNIQLGSQFFQIPFKTVSYEKREVVTCIAPLFANEQWQNFIIAVHIAKRYGSFLHIYIRSIIEPLFKIMKEYEKEDYLKMDVWPRINLSTVPIYEFNPNLQVEFRNQAGAQTDCLLQYKESADFIALTDFDEILIPRLAGSYFEEFELLYNADLLEQSKWTSVDVNGQLYEPEERKWNFWWETKKIINYLHYTKANVQIRTSSKPENFSIDKMISSIYFTNQGETGKIVTRPSLINHTWVHFSFNQKDPNFIRFDIPVEKNALIHLKHITEDFEASTTENEIREPNYLEYGTKEPLINKNDIKRLQEDFKRMKSIPEFSKIWKELPQKLFYSPLIASCFRRVFYKFHDAERQDLMKCPNPDRCRLPEKPGILCVNVKGDYLTSPTSGSNLITIHYGINYRFVTEDGCNP